MSQYGFERAGARCEPGITTETEWTRKLQGEMSNDK